MLSPPLQFALQPSLGYAQFGSHLGSHSTTLSDAQLGIFPHSLSSCPACSTGDKSTRKRKTDCTRSH